LPNVKRRAAHEETREKAQQIPCARGETGFVKVIDLKVRQAIFSAVATEVLKVQITANPRYGSAFQ
jgi:hypothetical protein